MFTKNWYYKEQLSDLLGFSSDAVRTAYHSYTGTMHNASGKVEDINLYTAMGQLLTIEPANPAKSGTYYGVAFGDGTAEPTVDDVMLCGTQHMGITTSNTTIEKSRTVEGDKLVITAVYTIDNTTEADLTISEVGLFSYTTYYTVNGNTASTYKRYLPCAVERTLLDTPITIHAGGVGKVTYTIRMNYPTA